VLLNNNHHHHYYFIVISKKIAKMTQNWQIKCGIFPNIYVRILGFGLGLVNIPGKMSLCTKV